MFGFVIFSNFGSRWAIYLDHFMEMASLSYWFVIKFPKIWLVYIKYLYDFTYKVPMLLFNRFY